MGLWSWLTGHDEKEASLCANFDAVNVLTDRLFSIASTRVEASANNVLAAVQRVNNSKGFSTYIGPLPTDGYNVMFDSITETVSGLGNMVIDKASAIKEYNDSNFFERFGSTTMMATCKVGEGLLSVGEELVDGVCSIRGWVAGKFGNTEKQEKMANFVSKDLSRSAFSWYYDSDFAKKSAFTEDSALAGAFELVGKTVGYLYAGGVVSGIAGAAGLGATTVGKAALGIASSSTWGAAAVNALGGLGKGTQAGLVSGLSYNDAFKVGAKSSAIQGGLAFLGGKASEYVQSAKANGHGMEALRKSSQYQGFDDAITRAGQDFGRAQVETVKSGIESLTASAKNSKILTRNMNPVEKNAASMAAESAKKTFKDELTNLVTKDNPISQAASAVGKGISSAKGSLATLGSEIKTNGLGETIKSGLSNSVSSLGAAAKALPGKVVENAAPILATGGVAAGNLFTDSLANNVIADGGLTTNLHSTEDYANSITGRNGLGISENPGNGNSNEENPFGQTPDYPITPDPITPDPVTPEDPGYETPIPSTTPILSTAPITTGGGGSPSGGSSGGSPASYTPYSSPSSSLGSGSSYTPSSYTPLSTSSYTPSSYTPSSYTPSYSSLGSSYTPSTYTPTDYSTTSRSYDYPSGLTSTHSYDSDIPYGGYSSGGGYGGGGYSSGGGYHSGSGYGSDGYSSLGSALAGAEKVGETTDTDTNKLLPASALDEIIKSSKLSSIPSATKPLAKSKMTSNTVVPLLAGLSVASAAGIGAKAYMDRNRGEEDEEIIEDEDDDFYTEDWENDDNPFNVLEDGTAYAKEAESRANSLEYFNDNSGDYSVSLGVDKELLED